MKAIRRFTVRTVLPEPLAALGDLARNLRWSWHAETAELCASVDPRLWAFVGRDPVRLLGAVSAERLDELAADRRFLRRLAEVADDLREYLTGPRWYQRTAAEGPAPDRPAAIAYFSPEFGITEALPQYSGGLGILAGDHLKAASDLGVPVIGVGLLYRHGYFRQSLSRDGWQQERYPVLDPNELPLSLLRDADGAPVLISLPLPDHRTLGAHVWCARVGRVPLLLLDSDVEANAPEEREVTDRLYGGGSEHRLHQEMLLGVGGVRAVRAYCRLTGHPEPEVFHTNEGHAGFLGVERIGELVAAGGDGAGGGGGLGFGEALEAVRAGTVFTTHTPVPAGIDRFERQLVARHLTATDGAGRPLFGEVPPARVLDLGAESWPGGDPNLFNMAAMGLRLAQRANGVSLLHGRVSREMFGGLWPGFEPEEVPISSITNGVHAPTWIDPEVLALGERAIGPERLREAVTVGESHRWSGIEGIDSAEIFAVRRKLRAKLVADVRRRLRASARQRGAGEAELGWIDGVLDPDVLTIGFARRVPSYKRLTLMLRDRERLTRLLLDPDRPVQLVVAGKAHPADEGGKRLIQELVRFADDPEVRHRIVFLPDYDMGLAQRLLPGCDVWLNNPLRPLEACGTSGMKAALNGCLNLSVLDGWWDEWYDPEFGWAIPTANGSATAGDADRRDDLEAAALYDLIEQQVAPRFYQRDAAGVPVRWVEMVRNTLVNLGPKVLAGRMVRQYVDELYTPAARAHRAMAGAATSQGTAAAARPFAGARELAAWKARVRAGWPAVRVEHVEASGAEDTPELGADLHVRVVARLGQLSVSDVDVQVVAGRVDEEDRLTDVGTVSLKPCAEPPDLEGEAADGVTLFSGDLTLRRTGPFGYTVRVLPAHPLLDSPAELGLVTTPAESAGHHDGPLR